MRFVAFVFGAAQAAHGPKPAWVGWVMLAVGMVLLVLIFRKALRRW